MRWGADGKSVWITHANEIPFRVERVDLASGSRTPLLSGMRVGRPGLLDIESLTLADDGRSYAYIGSEYMSHIFECEECGDGSTERSSWRL